jgi:hypothetical protein
VSFHANNARGDYVITGKACGLGSNLVDAVGGTQHTAPLCAPWRALVAGLNVPGHSLW